MSDSTLNTDTINDRPSDGSAVFTHPETPYLIAYLSESDRAVLHELIAGGKRFTITEKDVINLFP